MKQDLEQAIAGIVKDAFAVDVRVELTRPDEQFGDFATNVALQLSKVVGKNPREIAEILAVKIRESLSETVADVSVAGPGFLNITVQDSLLTRALQVKPTKNLQGKVVVAEYSDPNPFKVLHAGHLYTSMVGDAIANLLESAGAKVHRVNFGGDVGLHVGKTMWAILQELGGEQPEKLAQIPEVERSEWMASCYVAGTTAYEEDEAAKQQVIELNKRVYQLHSEADHDSPLAQIYWTCRQWSYEYFNAFYKRIGTPFEKYYPESEVAPLGLRTVREQLAKGVYTESDGAIVFEGEPYGLHTRVFINSHGLPTYEAKDVGLIIKKWDDYQFDRSVVITGNDIAEYMKVVLKSVEQFKPEVVERTTHFTHGNVKLQGGVKMSSRKGNFLRAIDVLDVAHAANQQATGRDDEQAVLGAVKYSFLKQRIGADLIYDPIESVSLEGNSGPYLQYAHARARSILAKDPATRHSGPDQSALASSQAGPESSQSGIAKGDAKSDWIPAFAGMTELQADERGLLRKITEYSEVVDKAVAELLPHHICTYLYELAQVFNRFYEHNRVINDERQSVRLQLVSLYADRLRSGLQLLGITAPGKM